MILRPDKAVAAVATAAARYCLTLILDYVDDNFPISGIDIFVSKGPGGRAINLVSRPGSASFAQNYPFKLSVRQPSPGTYEGMISLDSWLLKSLKPNDKIVITGLGVWFPLIANDVIWLGVLFDRDGEVTSASIDSYGQGDTFVVSANAWADNHAYVEDDGEDRPKHQASRMLVAYTQPGDAGQPVISQCCFNHLLLRAICVDNRPAQFPFPSPYRPYTA